MGGRCDPRRSVERLDHPDGGARRGVHLGGDDRAALRLYGDRFGAKPSRWRIAAPADRRARAEMLHSFGVVVIPDGLGGFIHNDAVYVVDAHGRLARIFDPNAPDWLLTAAVQVAAP